MSRKVVFAKLHSGFFIKGVGNFNDTLPPEGKTLQGLTMYKQEDGSLQLNWFHPPTNSDCTAEIGASTIIVLSYEALKRGVVSASNSSNS